MGLAKEEDIKMTKNMTLQSSRRETSTQMVRNPAATSTGWHGSVNGHAQAVVIIANERAGST